MTIDLDQLCGELDERLAGADAALAAGFPGEGDRRQPVHTVYVPADRVTPSVCADWGRQALAAIDARPEAFAEIVGGDQIVRRVRAKLSSEPIEDLRVDFEDGYGARDDVTEDADVDSAATALSAAVADGAAPPYRGIRIKCFEAATRRRGLRTLTRFVRHYAERAGTDLNDFVVTLPKVTSVDQVEAMVHAYERIESALGIAGLRFEIQVETPQSILGPDGTALVARMIHASAGRCTGLHYGTYDYSAACGIAGPYQSMAHPAADHAKLVMQAAAAGTGVWLSDGSTNQLPVGDAEAVWAGWRTHYDLVRRSLRRGYYQGWDLHPAQLPTRYAATIGFFRDGLDGAQNRLHAYLGHSGGTILDEPATARALSRFVLRALDCGATTAAEVEQGCGTTLASLTELARTGYACRQ